MDSQFKCDECGGTETYLESGFYYCQECHMQAHGRTEALFESQEATGGLSGQKINQKKQRARAHKKNERISTFETYNYIVLGLVNELIAAGAKRELRATVKCLWFKYLERLEVIRDGLPKFSAVFSKVDAEVFYGRSVKRLRKRSTSPDSNSEPESLANRSVRIKRKQNFFKSNYENEASSLSHDASSVTNQSLTSLKSTTDDVKMKLLFNRQAKSELLKKGTKNGLKRRCIDDDVEDLPTLTYRSVSAVYRNSSNLLTRHKLYCLIYLGLLLVKDRIQLGDLLRLIREGHLSYNSVNHFFPEDLQEEKIIDLSHYLARKLPLTHFATRQMTMDMAKLLEIPANIPIQNLVDLCGRYCQELNLPRELLECVLKIMAQAEPAMKLNAKSSIIPNYEARAMSFVIFTIKLLFGLDDATEFKFSEFAKIVNHINEDSKLHINKMFVFDQWMKHIQCRRFVLKHHHFPTSFSNEESLKNVDLFADFLQKNTRKLNEDEEETLTGDYEVYKKLLLELQDKNHSKASLNFRFTFTPFRDYSERLLQAPIEFLPQLFSDFTEKSVGFLLKPHTYLQLINGDDAQVKIKHRGANNQMHRWTKILNPRATHNKQRKNRRKMLSVKLQSDQQRKQPTNDTANNTALTEIEYERMIKAHRLENREKQKKTARKLLKLSKQQSFSQQKIMHREEDVYNVHYNPFETYWIASRHMDRFVSDEETFEDYLETLPHSFVFLLEECARILEMDARHVLEEYVNVEMYLRHVVKFHTASVNSPVMDEEIKKLVNKAQREW